MLMCKKAVPLQAEQALWLEDTDEEIDEQELEVHYSYMANIQEVPNADSGTDTESLEKGIKECRSILTDTSRILRGSNSIRDSCLIALQNKYTELETYKTLNDYTVDYDKLELLQLSERQDDELVKLRFKQSHITKVLVKENTNGNNGF
ncbi:hypothetical protein Tco_1099361 [Tanacetum coccineum]